MAISVTTPQSTVGFIANGTSADASGTEVLVAGVAGKKIKVRHVTFNNLTAGALSFTLSGAAALIGAVSVGANSSLQWDFNPYMELAVAQDLEITAGAGAVCVFAQGKIE
jgi:pantoate kinase